MKPLRIVHCANFSESKNGAVYYAIDRKLSNGLIRNGHFVYDFSYREIARCSNIFKSKKFGIKEVNKTLLETVKNIEPHLLLLGHSELITNDTLFQIREKFPNIKIAMWWVDSFDEEKIKHLYNRLEIIDTFFATTHPNYIIRKFNIIKNNIFYLPNVTDASIDTLKNFSKQNLQNDLLYIGKIYQEKENFFHILKQSNVKTKFYNGVYGHRYYKILSKYYFGLNFSKYNDISLYSSDRIIHLTANGLLTFTPTIPEFNNIFSEDEVIYFNTLENLFELYERAVKDKKRYIKIAHNGWRKAHQNFNNIKISQYLIEKIFDIKSDNAYSWEI